MLDFGGLMSFWKQTGNESFKVRAALALILLAAVNIAIWLVTLSVARNYPLIAATAWIAYAFGLRHAVDADHISAIDNTTRKLMREGKQKPIGVSFFFSLGHSTVVILLCAGLATATVFVQRSLPAWSNLGTEVGTLISGGFLYLIGLINLVVLWDMVARARKIARNPDYVEDEANDNLVGGGLARLLRPLMRIVRQSWQMYFVGFLFGLGFDTATEIGLLAQSAHSAQSGLNFWVIMLLPLLFTAGMCLIDTLNGIMMIGAYGWAMIKPIRRLSYNIALTLMSVFVAFVVGTHELLAMINVHTLPKGAFWEALDNNLGFVIVATFASVWGISLLVFRLRSPVQTRRADAGT